LTPRKIRGGVGEMFEDPTIFLKGHRPVDWEIGDWMDGKKE